MTSIVSPEVRSLISEVTTRLEDRLGPILGPVDYGGGVDQFVVFFVSVDSDPLENERYCVANNRAGRYKDLQTGKSVRFVGIAIPVSPETVSRTPQGELPKLLETLLLAELESPAYAMPQKFNRERLLADVRDGLCGDAIDGGATSPPGK
ncbi:MAG TPA: hypothetical protein VD932_06310 [Aquabacterium sp.]|nr:hypothetical protein [Aquabacterium sp.]